jgi:hypothetical protein
MEFSVLERAFQLAQNGPPTNLDEIRAVLKSEGYSDGVAQTSFPTVRKQLREAIQKRLGVPAASSKRRGVLRLTC